MSFLLEAWRDKEDGATAIEYALIAALVSIIIVGACLAMGQTIAANFFGPISAAL